MRWGLIGLALGLMALSPSVVSTADATQTCGSRRQLVGDVTGDGRSEDVSLTGRWRHRYGCRYVLKIRSSTRTYRLRLREGILDADVDPTAKNAGLYSLANIDKRRGAEILVLIGPSSPRFATVGVYRLDSGRIRPILIARRRYEEALFGGGGSGSVSEVTDCWRRPGSGFVISSSAEWGLSAVSRRVTVTRRVYRIEHDAFRPVWSHRYRLQKNDFPEFRGRTENDWPLFQNCRAPG